MSLFDPTLILNAETTEVNTRRPPLPPGDYVAIIQTPKIRPWKKPDTEETVYFLSIPMKIQVPAELQAEGQPAEVTVTQDIGLDLTENGTLDNSVGKNMGQRRYREALGMNVPGESFSWAKAVGQLIGVKLGHREYNGELYEDVKGVHPAA